MYRPRTVYRGKEKTGRLATLIVSVLVLLIVFAVWLFYDLQQYMVYDKDGARLVLPAERAAAGAEALPAERPGTSFAAPGTPVTAEIIVDKADYSGLVSGAGAGLGSLHARFIRAEALTGTLLSSFITGGLGDYDALVLELKPASGLLSYRSTVPLTGSYALNGTLELQGYAEQLKEKGVWLVAQLSALPDAALAARNAPIALKDAATGGVYQGAYGAAWLDPYHTSVRAYLAALMAELKDMGFDEVLFDGLYLPEEGYAFSVPMTDVPDAESAVSSLALYLRETADALELRVSGVAADGENGQDAALFFKAFDRVACRDGDKILPALESAAGGAGDTRLVLTGEGYVPDSESYIVK